MARVLMVLSMLVWGLWLGGLVALFLFVQMLFHVERPLAVRAAPILFTAFERYQLILAAAGIVATAGWRMSRPGGWLTGAFVLLCVAALGSIVLPIFFTAPMQSLLDQGLSGTAEFRKLHGESMGVYLGIAGAVLGQGVMMLMVMTGRKAGPGVSGG